MRIRRIISIMTAIFMLLGVLASCDLIKLQSLFDDESGSDMQSEEQSEVQSEEQSEVQSESESLEESESNTEKEDNEYRVLFTSDMHYTTLSNYYKVDRDTRLQFWVDGILEEHSRRPFDLIIILGDMSLDYWGWNGGGSYQREPSVSDTKIFMEKYVSQLPQDVPVLVLPGNHELYTNEKWNELVGNDRNESFVLGDNLFVIPDSYAGAVDPEYEGGGKNDGPYAPVDMDFVQGEIDKHPECKNIFLVSHHFDMELESEEFKTLLKTEDRIVGLFSGHTHQYKVKSLGYGYNNLSIYQTGSFADSVSSDVESFSWGFRDLIINEKGMSTSYIRPYCEYFADGVKYIAPRKYIQISML